MIQIIPAILAKTEQEYKKAIEKISNSVGLKDGWVHIDFMDNIFVQNKSIGPEIVAKYPNHLKKEAHLMVAHPAQLIYELIKIGFERIIVHAESDDVQSNLDYIEDKAVESGLAIKHETPIEKVKDFLDDVNLVLAMSVEPGHQGNPFIPDAIEKIKEILKFRLKENLNFLIGVDGGISTGNVKLVVAEDIDNLVIGSHLLKGDIDENLETLWEAINK